MNILDQLALNAPPCPDWFVTKNPPEKPLHPDTWKLTTMATNPKYDGLRCEYEYEYDEALKDWKARVNIMALMQWNYSYASEVLKNRPEEKKQEFEYKIVKENAIEAEIKVNELLDNGWEIVGEAQPASSGNYSFVYQTLIRSKKENI